MNRAAFHGREPTRDDGLRQVPPSRLSDADRERINRDIRKHLDRQNRLDAERAAQRTLYGRRA